MGKHINNKVKYRLIISKESNYGSWSDVEWEGENKWDSILEEKYCLWMCKKSRQNRMMLGRPMKINGSKNEIEERILSVDVQIGEYDKKRKNYKWQDWNYKAPLDKLGISMR
jgi:hypothetical protein